jgi:hypothetical protein
MQTMFDRDKLPVSEFDMFVIDVLRHDIEDVAAVLRMLNNTGSLGWRKFSSHDFTREEVKAALARLIKAGLATPLEYDSMKRELVNRTTCRYGDGGRLAVVQAGETSLSFVE